MSRKPAITIAIVSSLVALASPAIAGRANSSGSQWPSKVATNSLQPKTNRAGLLSSFAFDNSGLGSVHPNKSNEPYQGGPHPR
jgi:hypothetical protein